MQTTACRPLKKTNREKKTMHQTSIWTEYLANMTSLFCVNFIEKKLTQHGRTVRFGGQVFTVWEWSQSSSVSEYQVIYWSQIDIWYQQISTSMVVISENENLDWYIRYSRMKENKKRQTWILLILEAVNATIINMKWQIHVGVSEGIQPWNQGKATGRAHMARISPNAFLNLYHPI